MMLKPQMEKYDSFLITEKPNYNTEVKDEKMYYLHQGKMDFMRRRDILTRVKFMNSEIDTSR